MSRCLQLGRKSRGVSTSFMKAASYLFIVAPCLPRRRKLDMAKLISLASPVAPLHVWLRNFLSCAVLILVAKIEPYPSRAQKLQKIFLGLAFSPLFAKFAPSPPLSRKFGNGKFDSAGQASGCMSDLAVS